MKNYFLSLFLFVSSLVTAQDRIKFTYDEAGNQISRMICLGCEAKKSKEPIKTAETLTADDLIKDDLYKNISYYPNPVLEELYVKWENSENNYVTSIELYSITGQLMTSYSDVRGKDMTTIAFFNYPQGNYILTLGYSNGKKKTLKIVKK